MFRLGWFSTGRGEGSKGLLRTVQESIRRGELDARIEFVFCSREKGQTGATDRYLEMVEDYGIPLVTFSYRDFKKGRPDTDESGNLAPWRLDYDREAMARLEKFRMDMGVLAGYMLIVGPEMCRQYPLLNLHPAAPGGPAGTWQEVIWQLIESGANRTGVKMHLAIPELDEGPTATYCTFSIRGEPFDRYRAEIEGQPVSELKDKYGEDLPLFRLIRQYGYLRELPLVVATIRAFSQGMVKITADRRIADAAGRPIAGYDLSREIDAQVRNQLPHQA
ncbi:MAG: formyltransferase family protein [Chloroflexota bacterium]